MPQKKERNDQRMKYDIEFTIAIRINTHKKE